MSKLRKLAAFAVATLIFALLLSLRERLEAPVLDLYDKSQDAHWSTLALWKKNTTVPTEVQSMQSQTVEIPGFVIPLEFASRKTKEFLLVPTLAACQHVAPPPANQTIHVRIPADRAFEVSAHAVKIKGRLKVMESTQASPDAFYEMDAEAVELL